MEVYTRSPAPVYVQHCNTGQTHECDRPHSKALLAFVSGTHEEQKDYKLWPAIEFDRLWQSLSNPAKRHPCVSSDADGSDGTYGLEQLQQ